MKYYIDFDNTLFNTEEFYSDLLKILEKYEIDEEKINLCYVNNFSNELFNPIKIVNKLSQKHKLKEEIKNELNLFFKDISKYLYNDTISFLEYLKSKNIEINLLTYGDYDYQNEKINKSFIKEYFTKIIITSKNKADLDLDYQNSVFIDDSNVQITGLLKKEAKVIRIRRVGNKHSEKEIDNVLEYENLEEYIKALKKDI